MMKMKYTFVALACFLIMGNSPLAHAADGKSYAGADCQLSGTGSAVVTTQGAITNNSAVNSLTVICPIVKDQNGIQDVSITVIDPGNGNILCRVLNRFRQNGVFQGQFSAAIPSTNGDPSTITFNGLNHDAIVGAHSIIRCIIPPRINNGPRFHLLSYHVTEWG